MLEQTTSQIRHQFSRNKIPNRINPPKSLRSQPTPSISYPETMLKTGKSPHRLLNQQRIQIHPIRHKLYPSLSRPLHNRLKQKPVCTPKVQEITITINRLKQGRPLSTPSLMTTSKTRLSDRIRMTQVSRFQDTDRFHMFLGQRDRMSARPYERSFKHRCYDTNRDREIHVITDSIGTIGNEIREQMQ